MKNTNTQNTPSKNLWLALIFFILSLISGIALFCSMKYSFDSDIEHFNNSAEFIIFSASAVCAAAIALVVSITAKNSAEKMDAMISRGYIQTFTGCSAALLSIALFVKDAIDMYFSLSPAYKPSFLEIAELVTVPAIAVFFITELSDNVKLKNVHSIAGIIACLSVNLKLFNYYFNFSMPLNSPVKNALLIMESAFLLFMLSKTRSALNKNTVRFFTFASGTAASVMGGLSLGLTLAKIFVSGTPDSVSLLRCILCFFVSLYSCGNFISK